MELLATIAGDQFIMIVCIVAIIIVRAFLWRNLF
jgi:hypothetical protein